MEATLSGAVAKAVGLGVRMGVNEALGSAPVKYTGRALCSMYGLAYTEARGRALLAALEGGKAEVDPETAASLREVGL